MPVLSHCWIFITWLFPHTTPQEENAVDRVATEELWSQPLQSELCIKTLVRNKLAPICCLDVFVHTWVHTQRRDLSKTWQIIFKLQDSGLKKLWSHRVLKGHLSLILHTKGSKLSDMRLLYLILRTTDRLTDYADQIKMLANMSSDSLNTLHNILYLLVTLKYLNVWKSITCDMTSSWYHWKRSRWQCVETEALCITAGCNLMKPGVKQLEFRWEDTPKSTTRGDSSTLRTVLKS